MTAAELNELVQKDPAVIQANAAVSSAKQALDIALANKNAAYDYWQLKIREYNNHNMFNAGLLRDAMNSAGANYDAKNAIWQQAAGAYDAAVAQRDKIISNVSAQVVAQQNAAAAAEIEAAKATQATANATQATANIQVAENLTEKAAVAIKNNRLLIIGVVVVIVVVTVSIILIKRAKNA